MLKIKNSVSFRRRLIPAITITITAFFISFFAMVTPASAADFGHFSFDILPNGNWNVVADSVPYQFEQDGPIMWVKQNGTCRWGILNGEQIGCPQELQCHWENPKYQICKLVISDLLFRI